MSSKPNTAQPTLEALEARNRELERKLLEISTLYNVSKALAIPVKLDELYEVVIGILQNSLHVDDYCLLLTEESKQVLEVSAALGAREGTPGLGPYSAEVGWLADILKGGEARYIPDATKIADFDPYQGKRKEIRSFLAVPLLDANRVPFGLLNFHAAQPNAFGDRDLEMFGAVGDNLGIAIDKARKFQRTVDLSNRDPLLNIYNRRYFFDVIDKEVSRAYRYNRPLSVIMLDIDHFKLFNDHHGHQKGDTVLRELSVLLQENLRLSDILARYGGEEFIILLPETDHASAAGVAEKLRRQVAQHQFAGLAGTAGRITITLGVSDLSNETTTTYELVERADKALYFGKALGRDRVCDKLPTET